MPIFTPPIEVPGTISVVFGLGNFASATVGQTRHPITSPADKVRLADTTLRVIAPSTFPGWSAVRFRRRAGRIVCDRSPRAQHFALEAGGGEKPGRCAEVMLTSSAATRSGSIAGS